jgi:hypothetical protein
MNYFQCKRAERETETERDRERSWREELFQVEKKKALKNKERE